MNNKGLSAEETIHEQDKEKRLAAEKKIKDLAKTQLTNPDPKIAAEIACWQIEETINHGTLLRQVSGFLKRVRLRAECEEIHKTKTWMVKVFGVGYQAPISVAVLCLTFLVTMILKKNGFI